MPLGIFLFFSTALRKLAATFGYPGVMPYLRAVPRDQAEKQAAVDLVMKGVVLCLLGVVFPLLVLIGAFPLYYGVRKLLLIGFGMAPICRRMRSRLKSLENRKLMSIPQNVRTFDPAMVDVIRAVLAGNTDRFAEIIAQYQARCPHTSRRYPARPASCT